MEEGPDMKTVRVVSLNVFIIIVVVIIFSR